jgi:sulfur carrier protein
MAGSVNMNVLVNGVEIKLARPEALDALLSEQGLARKGVAVALNGEVVPRSSWTSVQVAEGDEVEVLAAAPGG